MVILYFIVGALVGAAGVALWAREALRRQADQIGSSARTQAQWEEHLQATTSEAMARSQSLASTCGNTPTT